MVDRAGAGLGGQNQAVGGGLGGGGAGRGEAESADRGWSPGVAFSPFLRRRRCGFRFRSVCLEHGEAIADQPEQLHGRRRGAAFSDQPELATLCEAGSRAGP